MKFSLIDICGFIGSSIENLAEGLKKEDCKHIYKFDNNSDILNYLKNREKNYVYKIFKIISGKGIFPYEITNIYDKKNYNKILKR